MSASSSQQPYVNNINNSSGGHNNQQHPDYEELVDAAGHNHHQDNRRQPLYEDGGMMMLQEEDNGDDSEEDTEEASETEMGSSSNHRNADEPIEIKEQMYQDKLATLKKQLEELRSGTHPEYVRRVKKLEHQYNERIRLNEIYREYLISCVERDYILEKNAAVKEYEEKKIDLRENLMTDFEDRRKMIENERSTMELTGDSVDVKPTITRKLRRRPNEPLPVPEKRRKPTTGQLVLLLDEKEVENDLKLISRGKAAQTIRNQHAAAAAAASSNGAASSSAQQNNHASPLVNNSSNSNSASHQVNNYSQQLNNSSSATTSTSNEVNLSGLTAPPSAPGPAPQPSAPQTNSVVNSSAGTAGQPSTQAPNNVASQSHHPQPQSQPQSNNPTTPSIPAPNNVPPPAPTPTQNPAQSSQQPPQQQPQQQQQQQPLVETRIEDGKLLYERRWFHRGQPVYVEGKDIARFSANISAIGSEAIWVKKTSDGQKVRIFTNQLSRGKVSIKRRAN